MTLSVWTTALISRFDRADFADDGCYESNPGPRRKRGERRLSRRPRPACHLLDLLVSASTASQATLTGGSTGAGKARVSFASDWLVSAAD
jgi:hypothetical protein